MKFTMMHASSAQDEMYYNNFVCAAVAVMVLLCSCSCLRVMVIRKCIPNVTPDHPAGRTLQIELVTV